jgi:O-6-methylguanine DNA methyltransferase
VAEVVRIASFEAPIGACRVASTERGLAYVELPSGAGRGLRGWLARFAPDARSEEAFAPNRAAITELLEYLEGKRTRFDLPLDLRATPFQLRVYQELLAIPYGETRSYGDVARAIGAPRALRAVGAASGANPIPLVIPCHRVIAAHGKLGGFGGGLVLKQHLLAMERSRPAAGRLL